MPHGWLSFTLLAVLCLAGCQNDFGLRQIDRSARLQDSRIREIVERKLSQSTANYLVRVGLIDDYYERPLEVQARLEADFKASKDRETLSALVGVSYAEAEADPDRSVEFYLAACYYSYVYLFDKSVTPDPSAFDAGFLVACRFYNYSLAAVLEYYKKHGLEAYYEPRLPMAQGHEVSFIRPFTNMPFPLHAYNDFLLCDDYSSYGFRTSSRNSGLGLPLIVMAPQGQRGKSGIWEEGLDAYPCTVFMRFEDKGAAGLQACLEFHDPTKTDAVTVNGIQAPLEVDITTYLSYLLRVPPPVSGLREMLDFKRGQRSQGLYLLTPYDKHKIPVVFVHGLMSHPRTWAQMINTLMGNQELRERYQFWLYAYPTGNPVLYSAMYFRKRLMAAKRKFDPKNENPDFEHMVLIGHSMGGLLSKMVIQDSGKTLERDFLKIPIDQLDIKEKRKCLFRDMLVFKSLPFVSRVIFIAVPHRGSDLALWNVSRMASGMITMPNTLVNGFYELSAKTAVNAHLASMDLLSPATGIDNLAPSNRAMKSIDALPLNPKVKLHSIIGNEEAAGVKDGGDSIVPYASAHLDCVESELVVKSDHSVHWTAPAINEVKRILKEHLKEIDKAKK